MNSSTLRSAGGAGGTQGIISFVRPGARCRDGARARPGQAREHSHVPFQDRPSLGASQELPERRLVSQVRKASPGSAQSSNQIQAGVRQRCHRTRARVFRPDESPPWSPRRASHFQLPARQPLHHCSPSSCCWRLFFPQRLGQEHLPGALLLPKKHVPASCFGAGSPDPSKKPNINSSLQI